MVLAIFIQPDGSRREIDIPEGMPVMQGAVTSNVHGIEGQCGGVLACGTCHVLVAPDFVGRVEPPEKDECEMLAAIGPSAPTSRLSCQITMVPALEGIVFHVPAEPS